VSIESVDRRAGFTNSPVRRAVFSPDFRALAGPLPVGDALSLCWSTPEALE